MGPMVDPRYPSFPDERNMPAAPLPDPQFINPLAAQYPMPLPEPPPYRFRWKPGLSPLIEALLGNQ